MLGVESSSEASEEASDNKFLWSVLFPAGTEVFVGMVAAGVTGVESRGCETRVMVVSVLAVISQG